MLVICRKRCVCQEIRLHIPILTPSTQFYNVLAAMNVDPIIRYHDPQTTLSARVAMKLKEHIDQLKVTSDNKYPMKTPFDHLEPPTVIIVERTIDLMSPLLHTLTVQAAAHDLLNIEKIEVEGRAALV